MKGYLAYLVLWIIKNKQMTGNEIALELEKRRGSKPSPGTIYPVLSEMKEKGLIECDSMKRYSLTAKGKTELHCACNFFCKMFYDVKDMMKCCKD